jgi:hypothetical protein
VEELRKQAELINEEEVTEDVKASALQAMIDRSKSRKPLSKSRKLKPRKRQRKPPKQPP